jgi:hypothetical protein
MKSFITFSLAVIATVSVGCASEITEEQTDLGTDDEVETEYRRVYYLPKGAPCGTVVNAVCMSGTKCTYANLGTSLCL